MQINIPSKQEDWKKLKIIAIRENKTLEVLLAEIVAKRVNQDDENDM